jgi:uncharacterized protein YuzE
MVYSGREEPAAIRTAGFEPVPFLGQSARVGGPISTGGNIGGQGHDSQRVSRSAVQAMKVNYFPETDSLYIDLSERPSVESREISEGVVLDYDETGRLVGIDIDNASKKVQLQQLVVNKFPAAVETTAS